MSFTAAQVQTHNTAQDCWIIVDKKVYNVTDFLSEHPGGRKVLLKVAGKDASSQFHSFHGENVLKTWGPKLLVGSIGDGKQAAASVSSGKDYESVKNAIKAILKQPDYDDGSIGPLLVRLAWHAAGTYDKKTKTGGSNGATMRFKPESTDGANNGLDKARAFLEPIKKKFNWISYADLWTLGGAVAIEAMSGPVIPWKGGRSDVDAKVAQAQPEKVIPPNGRLPDAAQGSSHIRDIFYRMGFNDQEIVALSGAHALGRCHTDRSGYSGPWTYTPTRFSNQYFTLLLKVDWREKKWDGPKQYVDPDDELMMLPSDMALIWDKDFKKYVELYASDKERFFKDFAAAYGKLLELGVTRTKL